MARWRRRGGMWGFKARLALSDVLLRLGERVAPPYRWRSDWADHPPTERVSWREPLPEHVTPVFAPRRPSDHAPTLPPRESADSGRSATPPDQTWRWRDGDTSPWSWR